jgi:hypothetical protein|tara:strand:- start:200 stop:424 length:225 start_codon:yes stop_codon:yes gene_type:complete
MEMPNEQYEIYVPIDDYIFNRFVKDKVRKEYKTFKKYKKAFPDCTCNFILRNKKDDVGIENKICLWDISERGIK